MGTLEARCSSTWWEVAYQCPAREERSQEIDFNSDPELIIESEVEVKAPSGGRNALDRLQGRKQGDTADTAGSIRTVNNIDINARQPNNPHAPTKQPQRSEDAPLMSPRTALETLRADRSLNLPQDQPWMHQDQNGRWVPRDEGYRANYIFVPHGDGILQIRTSNLVERYGNARWGMKIEMSKEEELMTSGSRSSFPWRQSHGRCLTELKPSEWDALRPAQLRESPFLYPPIKSNLYDESMS
ncbi:hypothetical protein HO173_009034 [Letharia columbiana]|uniref:Uncharacterized protein n=1 Tax=Letharia columbiana TaxID=112416 RepID=A0A8H6L296_9LECA|nr:uncharacterized protein HO173_009034 [Letharia columbiana]KAF6232820.1 hypothetical protein HO173_009034 [Letharia columbiana]